MKSPKDSQVRELTTRCLPLQSCCPSQDSPLSHVEPHKQLSHTILLRVSQNICATLRNPLMPILTTRVKCHGNHVPATLKSRGTLAQPARQLSHLALRVSVTPEGSSAFVLIYSLFIDPVMGGVTSERFPTNSQGETSVNFAIFFHKMMDGFWDFTETNIFHRFAPEFCDARRFSQSSVQSAWFWAKG